jgi:hypothetical protein
MSIKIVSAVVDALERAPAIIVPLVREVPEEVIKRRPSPDKWSAHEHACHLAEVHPLFSERLDRMLREDNPIIEPYSPDQEDQEGALLEVDLAEALARFESERKRLVETIKDLHPDAWKRTADHAEYNPYTVFIMFRHLALHDSLHAYRIEELLLKRDWE